MLRQLSEVSKLSRRATELLVRAPLTGLIAQDHTKRLKHHSSNSSPVNASPNGVVVNSRAAVPPSAVGDRRPRNVFDLLGSTPSSTAFWKTSGDAVATDIATNGIRLHFESQPQLSTAPPCSVFSVPEKCEAIRAQTSAWLDAGVVSPVPLSAVGFWSHVFVTPKKSGAWRLIIDLSVLNTYLIVPTFQMIRVSDVLGMVRSTDLLASLDIESAYLHVPIAPEFCKFFHFRVDVTDYAFEALP